MGGLVGQPGLASRPPHRPVPDSPMGDLKATFSTGLSGGPIACVTGRISAAERPLLPDPPCRCRGEGEELTWEAHLKHSIAAPVP